ncbi:MAG: 23S rRNA (adenine(2503)-C(2))-methyltransferase RlmN [Clostridia bacterium]|nr:23S rRNA (adenine(2503)-C(2))-methyltransferase RlmN [Clostridia bacterium]
MGKTDILGLLPDELSDFLVSIGEPKYRGAQLYGWLMKGREFEEMTNLPRSLREKLSEHAELRLPKVEKKLVSAIDGTVKYLFKLIDGECVESVVMRYEHGISICISSEVGCPMGCVFCASTIGGKVRNLTASEMLGQIIVASRDIDERISNVVMMGIGEPLDNYDNTIRFLKLVNEEKGLNIGYRHISLSTCGVVPMIDRLREENLPITLSISLHAAEDEARSAIMPINRKYPLSELMTACRRYFDDSGRRISFEYTLIRGKNDSERDADTLIRLLKKYFTDKGKLVPLHVNLIPVNEVKGRDFSRSDKAAVEKFSGILNSKGVNATVRRRLGADINASCGQLRRESRS